MKKHITLQHKKISYTLKRSSRAKYMRLTLYHDGNMSVTAPRRMSEEVIAKFLAGKAEWIIKKIEYFTSSPKKILPKITKKDFLIHKERARALIQNRIAYFNTHYNFIFKRISIRRQKTRWGSCSNQKNLSFNYRIALLPPHLADYIIVHELCHLQELNHSRKFWQLVARTLPEYQKLRSDLKNTTH